MDTKSKKSTAIISLIAFFLGATLMIGGVTPLAYHFVECASEGDSVTEDFQPNYQETQDFRDIVSAYFETFAAMATGGPIYTSWNGEVHVEGDIWVSSASTTLSASALNEYLQQDTNLLYNVYEYGRLRYYNTTRNDKLDWEQRISPDGYNFLLYFDGQKAYITKDGADLDIYGDGVYRGEGWYLPGYSNFPAGEELENIEIVMAIREHPTTILNTYYQDAGESHETSSVLYLLDQMHQERLFQLTLAAGLSAAGAALLVLWLVMKKARCTGILLLRQGLSKIWWEGKLLFLGVGAVLTAILGAELSYSYYAGIASPIVLWELPSLSQLHLFAPIPPILAGFWLAVLAIFDLCGKPWRNTLAAKLFRIFRSTEQSKPFLKRVKRRSAFFLGISAVLAILLVICTVLAGLWGYDDIAFSTILTLIAALPLLALLYAYPRYCLRLFREFDCLSTRISSIREGDFSGEPALPPTAELSQVSQELQEIQQGLDRALEDQIQNERMKVELITNVSHDLKTPLTSIISYAELLDGEELPPQARDYVQVLRAKAQRLQLMVQDVFEVSKAASGQLPVTFEQLDLAKLLRQTLADMEEAIAAGSVTFRTQLPDTPVLIRADGQRLYRVFQNLIQNALQYSLEGSRVYIQLQAEEGAACATVKNISKYELPAGYDFTERFVRGDNSRSDGGSGLGLSIARSFTEACGGKLTAAADGDLFMVKVSFPIVQEEIKPENPTE